MIPLKDENPRSGIPFLTISFIVINVVVFYFEIKYGLENVVYTYGAIPSEIMAGENLKTLFTSMFLHGGPMHLIGNMLYLWIFGDNIENYLGHGKFVFFYFICGLVAVFAHILLGGISETPMVGASGAISGVLGAYLVKYPKARVLVLIPIFYFITIRAIPAVFVLGLWFVMQLFSGISSLGYQGGGVAFWAHVGGFVAGAGLIYLLPGRKRRVSSSRF